MDGDLGVVNDLHIAVASLCSLTSGVVVDIRLFVGRFRGFGAIDFHFDLKAELFDNGHLVRCGRQDEKGL